MRMIIASDNIERRYIDKYYIRMISIVAIIVVNSLCAKEPLLGLLAGGLETAYLIYLLLGKSISDFCVGSLILLSTNIENQGFALGDRSAILYSLFNLPVVRGYLLLFIMLAAMIKCFMIYGINIPKCLSTNLYRMFYLISLLFFTSAILMAFFSVAINDNGMIEHLDMWRYIARDFYEMVHVTSIVVITYYSLKYDSTFVYKLKDIMLGILSAITYSAVILILCGNYYNVWGSEYYITCPLILFFAPGLVLFLFEKHGMFHLITGALSLLIQLRYTVGIAGTWWIYIFIVGVLFFRKIISIGGTSKEFFLKIMLLVVGVCVMYYVFASGVLNTMQGQVTYKLSRILDFFRGNGNTLQKLSGAGASISMRIEEMVSVVIEIFVKPWFILFGKGYGGTALQRWGASNWNISGSTFSDIMIKYQTYSAFHIALAEVIINFGLVGIILIVLLVREFIAEFLKKNGNSWILLGVLWFGFFYSLYYSLNLGLVWLCYGLYIKYEKKEKGF